MSDPIDTLIAQLKRIYLRDNQAFHRQMPDGDMPASHGVLIGADLRDHLAGSTTIVVRMIDADGNVKFSALDFDLNTPEAWGALMAARNLIVSLGLPAPLVTASGGKGYHLLVP